MKRLLLLSVVVLGSVSFATAQKAKTNSLRLAKQNQQAKKAKERQEAKNADYKQKHQPATDKITKAPEAIAPAGNRKK